MKLLLDIGNSRVKWAWWEGTIKSSGAADHRDRPPIEAFAGIGLAERPHSLWGACVASDALRATAESWAQARGGSQIRWLKSTACAGGVTNGYRDPAQLGVDRWLAVVAAFHRAKGAAAVVVDAGTALTLDAVTGQGRHLGGLIAPGPGLQRLSLRQHTQLRPEGHTSPGWTAEDTTEAIARGTLHASLGMIERVYAGICSEYGAFRRYLTGGEAAALAAHLGSDWVLVPDLVLEGLGWLADEAELHDRPMIGA